MSITTGLKDDILVSSTALNIVASLKEASRAAINSK